MSGPSYEREKETKTEEQKKDPVCYRHAHTEDPTTVKKTSRQNSVKIPPVLDSVETSFSSAKWLIYNNSFGRIE